MDTYPYKGLDTISQEIRLIRLKPGNLEDEISFAIIHAPLRPNPKRQSRRLSIEQLRRGLPDGYTVQETLSGRYLFGRTDNSVESSSWDHPNSNFDRTLYDLADDDGSPGPEHEPAYEALSYTWASTVDSVNVCAMSEATDGSTSAVQVQIGGNLACALRHLRYDKDDRLLWIDALCIDQNSEEEKSRQVKRMGSIYSCARRVVVWLGPRDGDSAHAISILRDLGPNVELTIDGSISDAPGTRQSGLSSPFSPLPYDERTWSSLTSLFRRGWFSRVWVIQEVFLANRLTVVYCGEDTIPWYTLLKTMAILCAKTDAPPHLKSTVQYQGYGLLSPTRRSLPRLLSFTRHRGCSVPHDKVYGILSLASSAVTDLMSPDYSKPLYEAFIDAARAHLAISKRLEFLPFCNIRQRCAGGPSWILNWAATPMTRLFFFRVLAFGLSSGLSAAGYSFTALNTMEVQGRKCAQVNWIGSVATGSPEDVLETIRSWEPMGLHENYIAGGTTLDAFFEVVFQGCLQERYPGAVSWPSLPDLRQRYQALPLQQGDGEGVRKDDDGTILKFLRNGVTNNAVLFTTKEGYLGVSETGVRKDDIICTLLGCSVPMILRPVNPHEFHVVALCYVHGLMHGESLLGPIPHPWELRMTRRNGSYLIEYVNQVTQEQTKKDPRLNPLPVGWIMTERERTLDDPEFFQEFRNEDTGEVLNSDPRLLPAALAQRGISLETFRLV